MLIQKIYAITRATSNTIRPLNQRHEMRHFDSSGTLHFMGLSAQLHSPDVLVIAVQWENSALNGLETLYSCV